MTTQAYTQHTPAVKSPDAPASPRRSHTRFCPAEVRELLRRDAAWWRGDYYDGTGHSIETQEYQKAKREAELLRSLDGLDGDQAAELLTDATLSPVVHAALRRVVAYSDGVIA